MKMYKRGRRKTLPEREVKRLRTLRANKTKAEISRDARKAGLMSSGKFNREKSLIANKIRWDKYRAEKLRLETHNFDEEDDF